MKKFDIYTAKFEYDETVGLANKLYKERPVLVLADDLFVPIKKITGAEHGIRTVNDYTILDWKIAGLDKPSIIRCDKEKLVAKSNLFTYKGHLSDRDINNLKQKHLIESNEEDKYEI